MEAAFDALGIPCDADAEGRVYPASRQAASVLDALRRFCDESGVDTLTDFDVKVLRRTPDGYEAVAADAEVRLAPEAAGLGGIEGWVVRRIDVDVIVACSVHLRETYCLFLTAFHHNLLAILLSEFGCKGSTKR